MKNIILKGNIKTKNTKCKHKNTGTSSLNPFVYLNYIVLIHPQMLKSNICKTFFWTFC